ncbi:sugar ABC transporter ATP-binding protein [Trebonia sp.]|uniref:sugar ABC transporter ATP-binding protein n=1 Tax=Trebonia sp. TaxID=2767075 RepID=UPI00260D0359|nr:sugar ABC transporter ATP-binding protein [Trebonia sp.]
MPDAVNLQGAHVELRDISKSFGGTRALEGVSLTVGRGSIHALVGENGAGKSTLGKIIAGALAPDRGQLLLDGEPVRFHSPRDAIARGVILIAQELAIVSSLTVEQNVFLGVEPRQAGFQNRRGLRRKYTELAASVGFELDGDANAGSLRTADQQKVEILRALCRNAQLIVMDEPTAALSRPDVEALHKVIRQLARDGTTVVLVSHFLTEVLELADEVTILRDGRLVRTVPAAGQTEESLMAAMLGRSFDATFPAKHSAAADAPVVLSVRDLVAPGVNGVSFDLRAGEILGLAGLVGAGRTEVARAIYRANRVSAGTISVAGEGTGTVALTGTPRAVMRAGVAMIPESRKEQGLLLTRSVLENVSLANLTAVSTAGLVRPGPERRTARAVLTRVDVRGTGPGQVVSALSGGNQQKLLFGRSLLRDPRVLIADEPTRGVDVGAKRAIYELLASLTGGGLGVLLISSDVEEILGLAHRVLVMRGGRVVAELTGDEVTEAAILGAAFGTTEKGA